MTQDQQKLFEYLQTQHLMAIATKGEKMWIASVYYAIDKNFNFYFVSSPKSQHCLDIEKNPEVACAIADSHQPNGGKTKIGVQMHGRAQQITGLEAIKAALKLWNQLNPGMERVVNLKNMQTKMISSRVYKIRPEKIKLFDLNGDSENEKVFDF